MTEAVSLERRFANFRATQGVARPAGVPGQGGAEHASERTSEYVSERAQAPTPAWGARGTSIGAERLAVAVGGPQAPS